MNYHCGTRFFCCCTFVVARTSLVSRASVVPCMVLSPAAVSATASAAVVTRTTTTTTDDERRRQSARGARQLGSRRAADRDVAVVQTARHLALQQRRRWRPGRRWMRRHGGVTVARRSRRCTQTPALVDMRVSRRCDPVPPPSSLANPLPSPIRLLDPARSIPP